MNKKNISNKDLYNALNKSLDLNNLAIDYIQNNIYSTTNNLGFKPDDHILIERLEIEKYIKHVLDFIDMQYSSELRKLGVIK